MTIVSKIDAEIAEVKGRAARVEALVGHQLVLFANDPTGRGRSLRWQCSDERGRTTTQVRAWLADVERAHGAQ